jgi:hypothetical protein
MCVSAAVDSFSNGGIRNLINHVSNLYILFPHRNVCSSQPHVLREQRRLCSGSAQGQLSFGSGLLGLLTLFTRFLEIINF